MESLKDKFKYAYKGLKIGLKDKSVRLQCMIMMVAFLLAFLFQFSLLEWIICIFCCLTIICLEFLNSIIERIMDFISIEQNEKIGDIKDMAAGLVLLASFFVLFIGILLYGGRLLWFIKNLF